RSKNSSKLMCPRCSPKIHVFISNQNVRRRDNKCARVELQHTACAVDFASNTRRRSKHNRHSMISGEPGQVLTNSDVSRLRIGRKLLKTLSATKSIHRGPRLARQPLNHSTGAES